MWPSSFPSLDNGIGWSSAGVDAGTFPFLTGIIIVLGSLYNLVRGVTAGRDARQRPHRDHIDRAAPACRPVRAGRDLRGCDPAGSGCTSPRPLYVFAVLAIPRQQSVPRALAMAAATALALYVVFERMFQVSLPHGALAAAFGF